ncbi:MAG: YerC/YecD family TrpR-related protein [Candidatus Uhrbacteria bacterium]|nr:YerC/YecD family TrpR-related protein [Candidatus Uhrbacteria bacterium]
MNLNTPEIEDLLRTIRSLQTQKDAKAFFRDLLTEKEIQELSMRWKAAQMLAENIPYVEIQKQTGLSSATVARISKWLSSGMNGYKKMITRNSHTHPSPKKARS